MSRNHISHWSLFKLLGPKAKPIKGIQITPYQYTARVGNNKGFTLIELLVVIAIIAILAAILFPVFSQAKAAAKKTASLAHIKQVGTGALLYIADYDDTFMATFAPSPDFGRYSNNAIVPVPADWPAGLTPQQIDVNRTFWINNTYPYIKNYDLHKDLNAVPFSGSGRLVPAVKPEGLKSFSFTMNGLLSTWSATAITAPSELPLFWNGRGRAAFIGAGYVNPYIECLNMTAPCQYVPASASTCTAGNGERSFISPNSQNLGYNIHSGGVLVARADSSAKTWKLSIGSTAQTSPMRDPFALYNGSANPTRGWMTQVGSTLCHAYLFRPDYDFATVETAGFFP
jgi:prepilin-type N-terminal cleavage/methylation domain-containing protein